jgi:hypothetical protein
MAQDWEPEFIRLWQQGLETAVIAQQLGITAVAAQSRAYRLQQRGLIQPRPRGGPHTRRVAQARQAGERPPSTVHRPPADRPPSTVDPQPSTVHLLPADLTAALSAALQPVLARLEALEQGLAPRPPEDRPPSTLTPWTVHRLTVHCGP